MYKSIGTALWGDSWRSWSSPRRTAARLRCWRGVDTVNTALHCLLAAEVGCLLVVAATGSSPWGGTLIKTQRTRRRRSRSSRSCRRLTKSCQTVKHQQHSMSLLLWWGYRGVPGGAHNTAQHSGCSLSWLCSLQVLIDVHSDSLKPTRRASTTATAKRAWQDTVEAEVSASHLDTMETRCWDFKMKSTL